MKRFVVDASVGIKWLLPAADSRLALALVSDEVERIVPDLFFSEIGNVLWKYVRFGSLSADMACKALHELSKVRLTVVPASELMDVTLDIACRNNRSFYDSLYLALALRDSAPMITADGKLLQALHGTPLAPWVTDIQTLDLKTA